MKPELARTIVEIFDYAKEQNNFSYYTLMGKAYNEEIDSWIAVFEDRQAHKILGHDLISFRKRNKIPYKEYGCDAMTEAFEARVAYHERHKKEGIYEFLK